MKCFASALGIVLVIGLTLASGIIHGRMSSRWGHSRDLLAMGRKLEEIPNQCGDWQLTSSRKMSAAAVNELQCAGHIVREYTNQETGSKVDVAIVLGPPGPTSVHTAEICYSSRDYAVPEERKRVTLRDSQGSEDKLWALTLQSRAINPNPLRVYYAWTAGDRWSAPESARLAFLGRPFLYKIQVAGDLMPGLGPVAPASGTQPETDDPCREFLQAFLPVVREFLDKGLGD